MQLRTRIRWILASLGLILAMGTFYWLLSSPEPRLVDRWDHADSMLSPSARPIPTPRDTAPVPADPAGPDTVVTEPDTAGEVIPSTPIDSAPNPEPSGERPGIGPDTVPPAPGAVETLPSLAPGDLIIPVAGIEPKDLLDTYNDSRSEGRTHNAIDIMAPRGTPVLAVADGRIVKFFMSEQGGITLYQSDARRERIIYYYAHLDSYAEGLDEGDQVRQGEVIGYVGDTGNAGAGNYHLHFSISITDDPNRYWGGTDINPYPILRGR